MHLNEDFYIFTLYKPNFDWYYPLNMKHLCILLIMICSLSLHAQNTTQSQTSFSDVSIDVLAVYEEVVANGFASAQVYEKLAHGRFEEGNYEASSKWFEKMFKLKKKPSALDYKLYATSLEQIQEFEKAKKYWKQFYAAN